MATHKSTRKAITIDSTAVGLPSHDLATIDGWDKLEPGEQNAVKSEVTSLDKALITLGQSRIAVGEHLFKLREILEPKGLFTKFLTCCTSFSRATAYRYVDIYTAAKTVLPPPVLQQAMLRGTERINLAAVEASPPPRTTNVEVINQYLSDIARPAPREVETSPEVLKRECWAKVHGTASKLPTNYRTRTAWLYSFLGMCLTEFGIQTPQSITPVAIPANYKLARGRPRQAAA